MIEVATEKWRPVTEWSGYEVSNQGRIRSTKRKKLRMLKIQTARSGHRRVSLSKSGKSRPTLVHQIVLKSFVGPCPKGMMCRHLNGDPSDNRLSNLHWGTRSDNGHDSVVHGTHPQARKTHCKNGHEYSPENTYQYQSERGCRTCRAEANRRFKAKQVSA